MPKKPKLTQSHYVEAQDRVSIILDNIDRHLIQHPVCKLDHEAGLLIEEAANKLYIARQLIAKRSISS